MQSEAIIHFELKYCERCGSLWLRPRAAAAVYCSPCARQMADIARRLLRRRVAGANSAVSAATSVLLLLQPWLEMALGGAA